MIDQQTPAVAPVTPAKSPGSGCLKAAGIGCLVIFILMGVVGYVGYRFVKKAYFGVMEQFQREGYRKVEGQFIEEKETLKEPTLYVAQSVKILNGSERGIALMCQSAEISGTVVGNVYFFGQELTIKPGAVVMRDLKVQAQVLNLYGEIKGVTQGVYQVINRPPSKD